MEEKAHSLTHSLNDKAVYRTAQATPGMLKSGKSREAGKVEKVGKPCFYQKKHSFTKTYIFSKKTHVFTKKKID